MSNVNESILNSVKQALTGVAEDYTVFDPQIIIHINSALTTLNQLGIGAENGYFIDGAEQTWGDYLGSNEHMLEFVKLFVINKVKMGFDPPSQNSFVLTSLEQQTKELEWRISVIADQLKSSNS